jgi:hypothetical protein
MKTKLAVSFAFLFALSAQAFAQKGGGGGGFGGRGNGGGPGFNRIYWYNSVDSVTADSTDPFQARLKKQQGMQPTEKKYIFVYIRPMAEAQDPNVFNDASIVELSFRDWAFVKMDFDKENQHLKAWGVKTAPLCIGCDIHSNDFMKTSSLGIGDIRQLTNGVPERVAAYEQKLKADFGKANDLAKSDENRAARLFVDIVANGKKGYKEVEESSTKVNEIAEAAFRRSELPESISAEAGIEFFDDLAKSLKGTLPGVEAEIRIARLDHDRGNVQAAIQRLLAILKYDPKLKSEIEKAAAALEDLSKAGEAKVDLALSGDKASAKETLRDIAKKYAGTEAAKKAQDAVKRFE